MCDAIICAGKISYVCICAIGSRSKVVICGVIAGILTGIIVRKIYLRKKQERIERRLKESLEKARRERRQQSRPRARDLRDEEKCVVCVENPKEACIQSSQFQFEQLKMNIFL